MLRSRDSFMAHNFIWRKKNTQGSRDSYKLKNLCFIRATFDYLVEPLWDAILKSIMLYIYDTRYIKMIERYPIVWHQKKKMPFSLAFCG
jgi:hypothetical protein